MVSSEEPPAKRWKRQPQERPQQILDAALRVFRARGFAAALMDDVAVEAGISKGTIYLYFASKAALLEALVEGSVATLAKQIKAMADAATDGPVEPVLRAMLRLAALRLASPGAAAVPLLVIGEAGRFPALAHHYRKHVIEVALGAISALIERAVQTGAFCPVDAGLAARTLVAPLLLQAIWNGVFARPEDAPADPQALVDQHISIFLHGIMARDKS